jgi:HlyD family secretion protein
MSVVSQDFGAVDQPALPSYRSAFLTAMVTIACLFGVALGWGMFAHLDAAVVTNGVVLAESQRKTVEHLEGGILERLRVRAGDRVTEGQIVATLDATQTREALAQFQSDLSARIFEIWRLDAEERNAAELREADLSAGVDAIPEPERLARSASERRLFASRLRAHEAQVRSLERQIDQLSAQMSADRAQASAFDRQARLWQKERDISGALVDKGAIPAHKLFELDRTIAATEGNRDEHLGLVEAARQQIARARAEIETLRSQRVAEAGARLSEALREKEGLESRIRAGQDVLERHNLRAPQNGRVVEIFTITPGAVLGSGAPLMEIVPDEDRLVIETRLAPESIDTVHVGRKATVRLVAYKRAQAPLLDAAVSYVSPDLLVDPADGSTYFDARVTIDPEEVAALKDAEVVAGMPVEIAIRTGERRAGEYFLEPLLRHIRKAFREE